MNNPRIPRAARTLIRQVQQHSPKATAEMVGEPDAFGVHRKVKITKGGGKWLASALTYATLEDERVTDMTKHRDGSVTLTFSARSVADQTHEFPLDAARAVAVTDEKREKAEKQETPKQDPEEGQD